jgi:hypothetical protein
MEEPVFILCPAEPTITMAGDAPLTVTNPTLNTCLGTPLKIEAVYKDAGMLGGPGQTLK